MSKTIETQPKAGPTLELKMACRGCQYLTEGSITAFGGTKIKRPTCARENRALEISLDTPIWCDLAKAILADIEKARECV